MTMLASMDEGRRNRALAIGNKADAFDADLGAIIQKTNRQTPGAI